MQDLLRNCRGVGGDGDTAGQRYGAFLALAEILLQFYPPGVGMLIMQQRAVLLGRVGGAGGGLQNMSQPSAPFARDCLFPVGASGGQALLQGGRLLFVELVRGCAVSLRRVGVVVQIFAGLYQTAVVMGTVGQAVRHCVGAVGSQLAGGGVDEVSHPISQLAAHFFGHGIADRVGFGPDGRTGLQRRVWFSNTARGRAGCCDRRRRGCAAGQQDGREG